MQFTVSCPGCHIDYCILRPELRGQQMRCPNPACHALFVMEEDNEQPRGGDNDRQEPDPNGTSPAP